MSALSALSGRCHLSFAASLHLELVDKSHTLPVSSGSSSRPIDTALQSDDCERLTLSGHLQAERHLPGLKISEVVEGELGPRNEGNIVMLSPSISIG